MDTAVRVGVLASGRGSNFEALLRAEADGRLGAHVVCLGSDQPYAPALAVAAGHGVPTFVFEGPRGRARLGPDVERLYIEALRAHGVNLVCLAGFMRILGGDFLVAFPGAVLNVHPSLLPSFPGLEPQRRALEYGVRWSGCTVHFVDAGVDSGAIISQAAVPVMDSDVPETLAARILEREHAIYPEAVRLWATGALRLEGRRVVRHEVVPFSDPPSTAGLPGSRT